MPFEKYDEGKELKAISRRYSAISSALPITLDRLRKSEFFLEVVEKLRENENWKDWHVLLAVYNAVINYHLKCQNADKDGEEVEAKANQIMQRFADIGESAEDPTIPLEYFTFDEMKRLLGLAILQFIVQKGGELRPRGYKPENIKRIVEKKYHYFELDIPHARIFD